MIKNFEQHLTSKSWGCRNMRNLSINYPIVRYQRIDKEI